MIEKADNVVVPDRQQSPGFVFERGETHELLLVKVVDPDHAGTEPLTRLVTQEVLRPIVDRAYPFDEASQALAHVEGGGTKGKVVITMANAHRVRAVPLPGAPHRPAGSRGTSPNECPSRHPPARAETADSAL